MQVTAIPDALLPVTNLHRTTQVRSKGSTFQVVTKECSGEPQGYRQHLNRATTGQAGVYIYGPAALFRSAPG